MAREHLSRLLRSAGVEPVEHPHGTQRVPRGRPKHSHDSYDRAAMRRYRLNLWAELMRERFGGDDIELERYARELSPKPIPRATLGNTARDVPKKPTAKKLRQVIRRAEYLFEHGRS